MVRCSSCGKRFRADEARLGQPRTPATFETLDYEVPPQRGWDLPDNDRRTGTSATPEVDLDDWREPEVLTYSSDRAPDYETPVNTRGEPDTTFEPWPTQGPSGDTPETKADTKESETPWGWIFGVALLLLFLVGGRFLSGEMFAVAFIALIAAQWIVNRKDDKK
jgi:hypothetical protein